MQFGSEERSRRLIERLDRIQNYLQSLPPLPKVGSVHSAEEPEEKRSEWNEVRVHSTGFQSNDESEDSVGPSADERLVATKPCRTIPKNDCGELLQQSITPSRDTSKATSGSSSPAPELAKMKNKKRRTSPRGQDPLKPTTRTSFGVDIGQGINVINYIKENAVLGSDARNIRLAGIITRDTEPVLHTDKSMGGNYKQDPLTAETSSMSIQAKNRDAEMVKNAAKQKTGLGSTEHAPSSSRTSDTDVYRVRYLERATELPHHHGLDVLQELFVPYMEHELYTDPEPFRSSSDYE